MISTCDITGNKRCSGNLKRFRTITYRRLFILGIYALALCWTMYLPSWDQEALFTFSEENALSPFHSTGEKYETLTWVIIVKVGNRETGEDEADSISKELGLVNLGKVGKLPKHFLLAHPWHENGFVWPGFNFNKNETNDGKLWHRQLEAIKKWSKIKSSVNGKLSSHPLVSHFEQQHAMRRVKRYQDNFSREKRRRKRRNLASLPSSSSSSSSSSSLFLHNNSVYFNDPLFTKQWHLKNNKNARHDMNVTGVWLRNVTGRGVTVAVVDDGLDWQSPDIVSNYNPEGSMDLVSNDDDPSPSNLKATNQHGTRCAGEIAATSNNSFCGVGVAFGARVSGIRLIEGPTTDEAEARAFSEKMSVNDVYSCSWGPEDDGKTLDGPHRLTQRALRLGTDHGRGGYGSIYVVASGNGGRKGDNCNYDGYANSVYTVTIGAVDEFGFMPRYSEECASMLAVAYSSGSGYGRAVVTSDWSMYGGTGCTEHHTGTSAAAPLASGIVALMLEVRPCLTWRDVQHLIALTAVKMDVDGSKWTENGIGLFHSHQHGFGTMDAWRLVNAAKVWKSVPWMTSLSTEVNDTKLEIRSGHEVISEVNVTREDLEGVGLNSLEYVHLVVTLNHEFRGQVEVQLVCPSGTSSVLGAARPLDDSKDGLRDWMFSTVRCWGEEGHGLWTVIVLDHGDYNETRVRGHVTRWSLRLYGSSLTSEEVKERMRSSRAASSGEFLNSSFALKCDPPVLRTSVGKSIPEKHLKALVISGFFLLLMALSDLVEYSFCHQEDKKEHSRLLQLVLLARSLVRGEGGGGASVGADLCGSGGANPVDSEEGRGKLLQSRDRKRPIWDFNDREEEEEEEEEEEDDVDGVDGRFARSPQRAQETPASEPLLRNPQPRENDQSHHHRRHQQQHQHQKKKQIQPRPSVKFSLKTLFSRFKSKTSHFDDVVFNLTRVPPSNLTPLNCVDDDDEDDDGGVDGNDAGRGRVERGDDDDGDDGHDDDDDCKDGGELVKLLASGS